MPPTRMWEDLRKEVRQGATVVQGAWHVPLRHWDGQGCMAGARWATRWLDQGPFV